MDGHRLAELSPSFPWCAVQHGCVRACVCIRSQITAPGCACSKVCARVRARCWSRGQNLITCISSDTTLASCGLLEIGDHSPLGRSRAKPFFELASFSGFSRSSLALVRSRCSGGSSPSELFVSCVGFLDQVTMSSTRSTFAIVADCSRPELGFSTRRLSLADERQNGRVLCCTSSFARPVD